MSVASTTIRPMRSSDVARAADVIRRGQFGEREQFLAWATDQPTIRSFIALADEDIVATGVASAHGPVGWVGMIFVVPERRGSGLGRAITRTVIEELEARGCRSQILIASPMGRPIYEREGFTVLDRQVRFTADAIVERDTGGRVVDEAIRAFRATDLDDVLAMDRAATGEDRAAVLGALARPDAAWVSVDRADRPTGFFIRPPWRGGGVIAQDPADALRLLELRRRLAAPGGQAGAGVLASNKIGRQRLRAAGWTEEPANDRMIRGAPLDWNASAIWGQLNGALG